MEQPGREDRLNAWIATERAARARLGASGTLSLAQVAALSPQEFFDRIGSGEPALPALRRTGRLRSHRVVRRALPVPGHPGPPPLQSAG